MGGRANGGIPFCNGSYAALESDWNGWWTYTLAGSKKNSPIEDRLIAWYYRRNCFATPASIWDELNFRGHVS